MNNLPRFLLPFALALTACEPQVPANLSPEASAEFRQLRNALEERADDLPGKPFFRAEPQDERLMRRILTEPTALIEDYARCGHARLCTPLAHQTLLHFAVQFRKEALVRELLQQGADVNATCNFTFLGRGEMDAPLAWTVVPETTSEELADKPYAETAIRLIDTLVAAGAQVDEAMGGHALFMCAVSGYSHEDAEAVYLHLLSLGANPRLGYLDNGAGDGEGYFCQAVRTVMNHSWTRALAKLIEMGHLPVDYRNEHGNTLLFARVEQLLYLLRSGANCYADAANEQEWTAALQQETQKQLAIIRVLLEHGANPNAPQGGGWTPMNYATQLCRQAPLPGSMYTDEEAARNAKELLISLLLKHGGDSDAGRKR